MERQPLKVLKVQAYLAQPGLLKPLSLQRITAKFACAAVAAQLNY
jgi:hypothetical protein